MGTFIRNLRKIYINNIEYTIELIDGNKNERFDVHIQNNNIKLHFKDYEFSAFVACFMAARKRFDILKGDSYE